MTITDALRGRRCYIAGKCNTSPIPSSCFSSSSCPSNTLLTSRLAPSHSHLWPNCNALPSELRLRPALTWP